jgi:predicted permease
MISGNVPDIIDIVLPAFFTIFLGYLVGRFSRLNLMPVVDITLYIGVPALVFVSLLNKEIVLVDAAKIWTSAIIIMLGCLVIAWLVLKLIRQKHSGLYVPISMMNTVNIPFPIIFLAYGSEGLAAATLFYIPNVVFLYTIGVYIMAGRRWRENMKEVLKQPVIYAVVLGLLLNFLDAEVPALIVNSFDFVSQMAIPLVLLVLGYNLSQAGITSFPTTLLASFLRMGVGLAIGIGVINAFNLTGVLRSVVVLDAAMPAAATSALLAAKYRNEAEMVASVVFLTTLVSLASIPFMLHLLG